MSNLHRSAFVDKIEEGWLDRLLPFLTSDHMAQNFNNIRGRKQFSIVYPDVTECFNAFKLTSWDNTRVVIVGQDPYHDGSADGLAFSASKAPYCPPSLGRILTEVQDDCYNGIHMERGVNYSLKGWAKQGVLLINTAFTVEKKKPGSHKHFWEGFTKEIFRLLREEKTGIVYLLWGAHAKKYKEYISDETNYVLEAGHPSPLNNTVPFLGCKHFSKTNEIIRNQNGKEYCIDWSI